MNTCTHAININDGRIVFRTSRTDELVALYRKIDEDTVAAIKNGDVGRMDVVNAIMSKEYASGVFNWKEFDEKRKELNMRTLDVEFANIDELAEDQLSPDKRGEVMSISEIKKSVAKTKAASAKKTEAVETTDSAEKKTADVELKI